MAYDPFARGPLPVGVRSRTLTDRARGGRSIELEVWYPASDAVAGRDLDDATCDRYVLMPGLVPARQQAVRDAPARPGRHPLVGFSHGWGSHRRQTTFLCTHLASHGYVVVAPDHTGNTAAELIADALNAMVGEHRKPMPLAELLAHRPADVSLALDFAIESFDIDTERIGAAGHSFGGWTTLAVTGRDRRVRAALPLAPAGGAHSDFLDGTRLRDEIDFAWDREVPTLFIVAERDTLLPLATMRGVFDPVRSRKQLVVIKDADHMHFCDDADRVHELFRILPPARGIPPGTLPPFAELCPAEHGYHTVRGLGLAHMDASLRGLDAARAFLDGAWRDALASRGIRFDTW